MNHNTLISRLPDALLVGAIAATVLVGCHVQGENLDQKPSATHEGEAPAATNVRRLNAAKSTGTILFAGSTAPEGPHDIYQKDLHTGQVTNLTNTPKADELNPQVSPDGKHAVYARSNRGGDYQIYRIDLMSRTILQLTNHDADDSDPTYTPSGDILYKSDADDGHGDIWRMTGDGQDQCNLTPDMDGTEEWKPTAINDYSIVFTSRHADDGSMTRQELADTDELMMLDTSQADAEPTRLTDNNRPDWYSEADPMRPGVIAFTSKATPGGPDAIYKMDVTQPDPDAHRTLLTDPDELSGDSSDGSWAPGGTLLFVNNGNADEQYRALARTPNGEYYEIAGKRDLSGDGDILSPVSVGPVRIK